MSSIFNEYETTRYYNMVVNDRRKGELNADKLMTIVESEYANDGTLVYIGQHKNVNNEIIFKILEKDWIYPNRTIASNIPLNEELFNKIYNHKKNLHTYLSANPHLTEEQCIFMLENGASVDARCHLASKIRNKEIQQRLAGDKSESVRSQLAYNTNLCIEAQHILKNDSEANVRYVLANRYTTALEVLQYLADNDMHTSVKGAAKANIRDNY